MTSEEDADIILREALAALEMPRAGVLRWLAHLARFYHRHGGARHYGECLDLLAKMHRVLDEPGQS